MLGGRLRRRERDAEDGIRPEPRLVARPVELDQRSVERTLVVRIEAADGLRDLALDVPDGLQD
jgi:hypothetical protein